jgi:hypothetical protein
MQHLSFDHLRHLQRRPSSARTAGRYSERAAGRQHCSRPPPRARRLKSPVFTPPLPSRHDLSQHFLPLFPPAPAQPFHDFISPQPNPSFPCPPRSRLTDRHAGLEEGEGQLSGDLEMDLMRASAATGDWRKCEQMYHRSGQGLSIAMGACAKWGSIGSTWMMLEELAMHEGDQAFVSAPAALRVWMLANDGGSQSGKSKIRAVRKPVAVAASAGKGGGIRAVRGGAQVCLPSFAPMSHPHEAACVYDQFFLLC